jgi:RNA ligase
MTALVEVIYPGWRIVLDYGELDDLVLHGFVDNATGRTYSPEGVNFGWPGPVAAVYPYGSLPEALAAESRPGAEGLVIHFAESDIRVKLKQADYLALHRLMCHLTARRLWTHLAVQARADVIRDPKQWATFLRIDPADAAGALAAGPDWYDDLIRGVPDEFYGWVNQRIAEINSTVSRTRYEIAQALEWFGPQYAGNRLGLLAALEGHPLRTPLTLAMDGRVQYIENWVWRQAKPPHEVPFRAVGEDVA